MAAETLDPLSLPWRVGTKNGRTLYAYAGEWAAREDVMIGVMDSPELAAEVCAGHNARLTVNPAVGLLTSSPLPGIPGC